MSTTKGKIRLFLYKIDEKDFEEVSHEIFEDCLISDVEYNEYSEVIKEEISNAGFSDVVGILDILKNYEIDDCIEIVGDIYVEYRGYGEDTECDVWLDNCLSRKLTPEQIERFCPIEDLEEGKENEKTL